MIIALDYDDTYTVDPEFWKMVIDAAISRNHTIICVTARDKNPENEIELKNNLPNYIDIYFTNFYPKNDFMRCHNIAVDVWIDDSPGWIVGIT